MKGRLNKLLPYISSVLLVVSVAFLSHISKEKREIQKALDELSTYEIKLHREKKALTILTLLRKEMEKKGLSGEEEGINLEASFVILDFRTFLEKLTDIYYHQGLFFLSNFEERTELPSLGDDTITEPTALAKIVGKKIVAYKP